MEQNRSQIALYAVAAIVALVLGVRLLSPEKGPPEHVAPVRVERPGADGGEARVYVHVAGAVRRPGLYRLRRSARVAVALERAGGPRPGAELAGVNLAARVSDGQQITVPRAGEAAAVGAPGGGAGGTAGAGPGVKVSLASATLEQLDALDGIGETLAKRILEYRDAHGGFRSVAELGQVEGIGEKRLAALREAVQP